MPRDAHQFSCCSPRAPPPCPTSSWSCSWTKTCCWERATGRPARASQRWPRAAGAYTTTSSRGARCVPPGPRDAQELASRRALYGAGKYFARDPDASSGRSRGGSRTSPLQVATRRRFPRPQVGGRQGSEKPGLEGRRNGVAACQAKCGWRRRGRDWRLRRYCWAEFDADSRLLASLPPPPPAHHDEARHGVCQGAEPHHRGENSAGAKGLAGRQRPRQDA